MRKIRHLAAGVIPEPAKVIDTSIRIVWPHRGRTKEHVPIKFWGRIAIGRRAETRHDVTVRMHAYRVYASDVSVANELPRSDVMPPRSLLRTNLHDRSVPPRD